MNEANPPASPERIAALASLAATEREVGPCPSDSALAAFIDGALRGRAEREMQAHVAHCPSCHQHWMDVRATMAEIDRSTARPGAAERLTTALRSWLEGWSTPYRVAVPTFAVLALAVVTVQWPSSDGPEQIADSGGETARVPTSALLDQIAARYGATSNVAAIALPWEGQQRAFSEQSVDDAKWSFGKGLWDGRQALSAVPPGETEPAWLAPGDRTLSPSWYELGRWTLVLLADASSRTGTPDWAAHQAVASALREALSTASRSDSLAALDDIDPLLADAGSSLRAREALRRAVEDMMNDLAPSPKSP